MDWILEPFREPLFQAIGWALVHFLWQGVLLAVILRAGLGALRRARASTRYVIACAGLIMMAVAPVAGTVLLLADRAPSPTTQWIPPLDVAPAGEEQLSGVTSQVPDAVQAPHSAPAGVGAWLGRVEARVQPWLPLVVLVWLLGVALGAVRLIGGWVHLRHLRVRWTVPVSPAWCDLLHRVMAEMGIRRPVRLLGSTRVEVPSVVGALKPVILIPASLLTGLSPRDVELILAHELAHVRRHDYLVNLIQATIETVLFFHPAVWWLSGVIREEREHCCDDLVVDATGGGKRYARALLAAEELRAAGPAMRLAPALGGGSLYRRIQRIITPLDEVSSSGGGPLGLVMIALLVAALGVGHTPLTADARIPAPDVPTPQAGALLERWQQARAHGAAQGWSRGFWIAYAVQGTAPREPVASSSTRALQDEAEFVIREVLERTGGEPPVVRFGEAPAGSEVTLLFWMEGAGDSIPRGMLVRTADQPGKLRPAPLAWLGVAPHRESLGLLARLYRTAGPEVRQEMAAAGALHPGSPEALDFVRRVLDSDPEEGVRAEAAYWLQHQQGPEALRILEQTAVSDPSPKVREEAVTGIAKMGTPESRQLLARLERTAPHLAVRREAGDWLMRGSPRR